MSNQYSNNGPAQDGQDATLTTPPIGGQGIRGWLSGLYASSSLNIQAAQVVAIGVSSNSSAAVQNTTSRVLLISTIDSWIKLAPVTPTAAANTNGSFFLPASYPLLIGVTPGTTLIGVISNTSSTGYLSVVEGS